MTDPPSPGIVVRTPITFLGMAPGQQHVVLEQFLDRVEVVDAVEAIRAAETDQDRVAAVNQLMENLG